MRLLINLRGLLTADTSMAKGKRQYKLSLLQEMHGELTAATLKSLTRVLCHEDYKVLRRHFRQGLVDSWTVALGSVCVSLFCAPFSSFLFSLLLRYCFSIPAMTSRSPKQKWRLMPKRPTLPQKTPFRPLIFSRVSQTDLLTTTIAEELSYMKSTQCKWVDKIILTNHITVFVFFFTSSWLADNHLSWNVLLFSYNPIGQLCLSGPGYGRRTVKRQLICYAANDEQSRTLSWASVRIISDSFDPYGLLVLCFIPQWLNHGNINLSNRAVKLQMADFY